MATVSNTNIALTEVRKRESLLAQKVLTVPELPNPASRLDRLRQRIQAKESAASSTSGDVSRRTWSASQSLCAGKPTPPLSKFDALRQRIKAKEMAAKGFAH